MKERASNGISEISQTRPGKPGFFYSRRYVFAFVSAFVFHVSAFVSSQLAKFPCIKWTYSDARQSVRVHLIQGEQMQEENQAQPAPPRERLLRINQVLERFPVSRSTWWAGVKDGRYPKGIKLSPRTTAWRESEVDHLIFRANGQA